MAFNRHGKGSEPRRCLATLIVALGAASATQAWGEGDADAAKGIVVEHCVQCHAVPGYGGGELQAVDAPSFASIAAQPDTYPDDRLRTSLRQPHFPMQGLILSASDVNNLIAFIRSFAEE